MPKKSSIFHRLDASFKPTKADRREQAKKLLLKRPVNEREIAEEIGVSVPITRRILKELRESGANFVRTGERLFLHNVVERGGQLVMKAKDRGDGYSVFGFVTDKHLCNRHERLDVLNAAYDRFAAEGVTDVFDAGNWIDGEARFNKQELLHFGMDNQLDYLIDVHPQRKGIVTHYVSGDDHEGWYAQRECINIGEYLELRAKKAGRSDLHFLGHVEADVELRVRSGRSAVMKVMHPGGGSSYAFSYAPQKIVESFQGGEKPAVVLGGHYHKFDYCYPREVHFVSGGCTVDQTMFMRKNKIAAHVGYSVIRIKQDPERGHIIGFSVDWNPFYDRGFYERRF
jgi:hypothetical protein